MSVFFFNVEISIRCCKLEGLSVGKYFFICEGSNTEVWYFRKLIDLRKTLGIHPLIDIRLMEKNGKDETVSNPKALIEFAEIQKKVASNIDAICSGVHSDR